jgi:Lysylphosphatidylglycerol synthase TM region
MKVLKKITALKISAAFIIFFLSYVVISNYYDLIENNGLTSQVSSLGFPVLIVVVPYFMIILSDTWGWLICFSKKMLQRSAGKLFAIRVATEALQTSLPGGAVYAELVRPHLLKKHLHLEYSESISANIITKINILVAQVIFLIFGLLVLTLSFSENITSTQFISNPVFYLAAFVFISVIFLFTYLLYRKDLLLWVIRFLGKIELRIVTKIVDKIRQPVIDINNTISIFSRNHKTKLLLTVTFFFFTWILMSFESLVILKVMGIDANISQMILIESLISIIRMGFFFIPGALGPQDAGLIILFNLVGLPDPILNAFIFVFLRRSKELVWIIAGYILLMLLGIRPGKLFKGNRMNFAASR